MVMYELSILKHILSHKNWEQVNDKLSVKDFPKELIPLFSCIDNFHRQYTVDLTTGDLANLVLATAPKNPDYYKEVLSNLDAMSASDLTTGVLIESLHRQRLLKQLSLSAYELTEGRGNPDEFNSLIQQLQQPESSVEETFEFVSDDLSDLLDSTYRTPGLRWRLNALNNSLGSLRGGDFGFVFARPETGKTTFLASEGSFMAQQLGDDDGPIVHFNNEEKDDKVKIRYYQAALGCSLVQLNANVAASTQAFKQITKGKILLPKNPGSISKQFVERVVKSLKPRLVIYDQIDKITGFDNEREDLRLGSIYQWGRELAKEHNHATIAVCQADGTGEGQKWLTMANVANAKTSKQAEADWILGIGKIHDTGYELLRYLHLSKNKLSGDPDTDPNLRHAKLQVLINPNIARYEDI